jgi:hypothetical protein
VKIGREKEVRSDDVIGSRKHVRSGALIERELLVIA